MPVESHFGLLIYDFRLNNMTLKQYLTIMAIATVLCWISWLFVIINIDPFQGNISGFVFFYITLFFSLLGTNSLLIFCVYRFFSNNHPMFRYVQKSFRESLILSIFIIFILFLQGMNWLTIWNLAILVLLTIFTASFLFSVNRHRTYSL